LVHQVELYGYGGVDMIDQVPVIVGGKWPLLVRV
jgi:hypothetical protein